MQDQVSILVVDDEPGIRTTLAGILEDEGYNVVVVEDGYKGIAAAEETKFKIAFIDMKMPGINGIESFKEIKKINPDTIIFFMTAFLAEDLLQEAAKLEIQAILYKPLDIDLLLKAIKEDLTKTTILVVDDEYAIRETLQEILEGRRYKVAVAEDGHTAIEMAGKTHFDIIFIDVVMPEIDGFQILAEIKRIDPKTNIIMTGHDTDGFIEKAYSQGAFAHITKPFDLVELLQLTVRAI